LCALVSCTQPSTALRTTTTEITIASIGQPSRPSMAQAAKATAPATGNNRSSGSRSCSKARSRAEVIAAACSSFGLSRASLPAACRVVRPSDSVLHRPATDRSRIAGRHVNSARRPRSLRQAPVAQPVSA
jgi:hypothetical protein